jgi:prepilin-type N-terminal cleavage/methylation domain-containing protein
MEMSKRSARMKKQHGFTLVEFLIAMGVTTVIVGAALTVFSDAQKSNLNVSMKSDLTDNLRAGLSLIQQDLIQAGTGIPTGGIPIPNTPNAAGTCNNGQPVNRPSLNGGTTFPGCNFVLPAVEPGADLGPQIVSPDANPGPNSDMITILYADNAFSLDKDPINRAASPGVAACNGSISPAGDSATFDPAPTCHNINIASIPVQPGDLIMFSNAQGNAIQMVTSVNGQQLNFAAGDPFNLNGRKDPQGTIIQLQSLNPVNNQPSGNYPPTTATRVWMVSYYLDNIADPQHVRLIRRVNFRPGQPVGETLENLQFLYNFVDGVLNPSGQPTVPANFSESQIRSVNVTLWGRSIRKDGPTGHYLRSNVRTQVSLRSLAYVSRYF